MNKHFKLLFLSKIPANRQYATLTSITSANVTQIAATKIVKDILSYHLFNTYIVVKTSHYPQNYNTGQHKQ